MDIKSNEFIERCTQYLIKAMENIDSKYFMIQHAGGDFRYLERIYCYELYHQYRNELSRHEMNLVLYGEVDKSGHPTIRWRKGQPKPDFILHDPGSMEGNCLVIEVKRIDSSIDGMREDLKKLSKFVVNYGYSRGVLIIFGSEENDEGIIDKIRGVRKRWIRNRYSNVMIIWHKSAGREIKKYNSWFKKNP